MSYAASRPPKPLRSAALPCKSPGMLIINDLSLRYDGKPFHTPVDRVIVRIKPERVLDHGIDD